MRLICVNYESKAKLDSDSGGSIVKTQVVIGIACMSAYNCLLNIILELEFFMFDLFHWN